MALHSVRSAVLRVSALGVGLALSLGSAASRVRAQAPRGLFSDERDARTLAPATGASGDPMVLRSRTATVNLTMLMAPGPAGTGFGATQMAARTVELNLFTDVNLVAQLDHVEAVSVVGGYAWVGTIAGVEASQVILAVADGVFDGAIILPQHLYSVRSQPDGAYAVTEINRKVIPPDPDPIASIVPKVEQAAAGAPPPTGAADSGDTFDLLLYYTTGVKTAVGGTVALNAYLTASIAQVNAVYTASAIPSRLRLVGAYETPYVDAGDLFTDLPNITANPDAKVMRDRLGADFVGLLVTKDPKYSGLAYIMGGSSVSTAFAPFAYSTVVYYNFISYIYALAHELGHNMGCLHEPGNNSNNGAYSYSQGYTDATNKFYTVMSYGLNCTGCTLINQFSSPVNTYQGHPVGTSTQDNQRTIVNTRSIVANFRQSLVNNVSAPTNFAASSSGSSVTLTWGAPTTGTATAYVIEAGSQSGSANLAAFNTGSTLTSFSTSGVGNGLYYVRVKSANGTEISPASNEVGLLVGSCTAAPPSPAGFAATASGSTVYLAWTASSTATTYIVEAGSSTGQTNLANSDLGSPSTMYTATGIGKGTYFVRMRAKNSCGTSGVSPEVRLVVS
ncbi:MAG: hypothetical protein HY047_03830 [Acidobacteria bacterium]|nr:hypothetical protein [Acidobacteriota bacterium]